LDAGALIAAERGDRSFWALWKEAELRDVDVTVPAPVVVQVFRGPRSAIVSKLLRACIVEPLDEARARRAGVLCGDSEQNDVTDAVVAASAAQRGDDIVTSDPTDLAALSAFAHGTGRIIAL
ncbi:MAG TPA: PIN domain-containing protein, partial [Polyangiaceae bacterium]